MSHFWGTHLKDTGNVTGWRSTLETGRSRGGSYEKINEGKAVNGGAETVFKKYKTGPWKGLSKIA